MIYINVQINVQDIKDVGHGQGLSGPGRPMSMSKSNDNTGLLCKWWLYVISALSLLIWRAFDDYLSKKLKINKIFEKIEKELKSEKRLASICFKSS